MHLLEVITSRAQRGRNLAPPATGEVRWCYAMTEPSLRAASEPSMLAVADDPRELRVVGPRGFDASQSRCAPAHAHLPLL
jgi:alkylation response protein AidB-like acyl-CoA dehydrogenase